MSGDANDDYYAILGIDPDADDAELRRSWRQLALRWHPDHAGPDTKHIFQKLLAAYNVMSDPVARAEYDRRRGTPGRSPAATDPAIARRKAPGVMLRRLSRPLDALLALGVARRTDNVVELFLDDDEVSEGGMATISMRVPVRCTACTAHALSCAACGTTRVVDDLFAAWLAIPPGVADGAVLTPSAQLPGILRPVTFRIRLGRT